MDWKTALLDRHLYVLESANSTFYVGQAVDPDRRIRKHFNGTGSQWTRLHPPMKILSCESLGVVDYRSTEHTENDLVLSLMRTHGLKNVRGGFFTNVNAELIAKSLIAHGYQTLINEQPHRRDLPSCSTTPNISRTFGGKLHGRLLEPNPHRDITYPLQKSVYDQSEAVLG